MSSSPWPSRGARMRRGALIGAAALAVAGLGTLGGRAVWRTARPAPRVPVAVAPAIPPPSCSLAVGQRFAYDGRLEVHATLDMTHLLAGAQGLRGVGLSASEPQNSDEARTFSLDLEVVSVDPTRGVELAAQLRDLAGNAGGRPVAEAGVELPFRVRLDLRCGLVEFGWQKTAPLPGARQQQALLASLSFHLPGPGEGARYTGDGFDSVGRFHALYQWTGNALLQRVLRYDRVFQDDAGAAASSRSRIDRSRLRVELAPGQWFTRVERALQVRMLVGATDIGGFSLDASYARRDATRPIVASDGPWEWGLLLDRRDAADGGAVAERKIDPRIQRLTQAEALANVRRQIADASSNPADYVVLLADWLRAHPEALPEVLDRIKAGAFAAEARLEAVVFHALANANTPETRQALEQIFDGKDFAYGHRVNAAQVMALLEPPPQGFVDRLVAQARGAGDEFGTGSMQLALGMFAAQHARTEPELARQARAELRRELDAAGTQQTALVHALQSAGNAAHDELYPDVARHLDDKRAAVREVAADALRNFSATKALPSIDAALQTEQDDGVRARLLGAASDVIRRDHRPPAERLIEDAAAAATGARSAGTFTRAIDLLGAAAEAGDARAQATIERLFGEERRKSGGGDPEHLHALGRFVNTRWRGR